MTFSLQPFFIIVSVGTLMFILRNIRKNKLNIDDSIIWIVWALFLFVISIFPQVIFWVSDTLGFMSAANFIFALFTFFVYLLLFRQTMQITQLKEKNKSLIQKLSIDKYEEEKKK